MANPINLEVLTPSREVLHETCDDVYLPGPRGEFGVLPDHVGLISALAIGELRYRRGSTTKTLAVRGGFAQILENQVIVLADQCVEPQEVSKPALEKERKEIDEKMLDRAIGIEDRGKLVLDRAWVEARLSLLKATL